MFPVLSRPHDDEIVEVYMADHDTKTKEQFEDEWLSILARVSINNPGEYNVSQIVVAMKRKGWNIFLTQPAKVTY